MAVTAVTGVGVLAGSTSATSESAARRLSIETASALDANLVSGGDVLLRVRARGGVGPDLRVRANGRDVTSRFTAQPDGSLLGLVTGLREGSNTVIARSGLALTMLSVTNRDRTGPVFSGPQQRPFFCETTAFGLEPAEQPDCAAPTTVAYRYRTTGGEFRPLADPADRPADLATATVDGRTVPYVIRLETGTINRAVYETAALYGADPSATAPGFEPGWNGKLVYTFGGGCNGGHHQGAVTGWVLNDLFLSRGYGVASSTLNVLDNNCGPVLSAETAMMVKERFAEVYGPIMHTIGWGGSGGGIQQYDIADAYPGILDGIVPGVSYPDPLTVTKSVTDCGLLNAFFAGQGASFTEEQRRAVSGYGSYSTCRSWEATFLNRSTPTGSCPPAIPVEARWDMTTNPRGVRCSAAEQWVNQLGRDPRTGFVRSVLDNTGVQYGLAALESGAISAEQFVALNAGVGGYNILGARVGHRTAADRRALAAAYRSDLLNTAGQGLRDTPIIDQRTYLDRAGQVADIHTAEMSFVMRERLRASNGTAANQVVIINAPSHQPQALAYELDAMDRWLTAIRADPSDRDRAAKVVANRPADLGDGCYLPSGERVREPLEHPGTGRCAQLYPLSTNPRVAAGEDLAMTRLACRLRPISFDDYPVRFTAAQRDQLRRAFPSGVCDYGRPGVEQTRPAGTWQRY
ncbi:hypothetical protein BU204_08600 [Actinophytocola xanthii]|uniref:DUF6351 domain-containing protein n=1 Tax=Actinophytocola xanthii TaxID=1912961 RepID=A0A1Q8CU75_9PSEU|nr:hypothetical protein BU204_08600 [Actinophytocola xanthii]